MLDSTKKFAELVNWYEAVSMDNTSWGVGEEVKFKQHTTYASKMDLRAFCGRLDFIPIYTGINYCASSYSSHFQNVCNIIYDRMNLKLLRIEMIGVSGIMCLGFGIQWKTLSISNKKDLEYMIELLSEKVYKFRIALEDYGY